MGNAITRRAVLILGASRGATRFQPVPIEINGKTREFPFRALFVRYLRYVAFVICECSLTNPSVPLKVFFSLFFFFLFENCKRVFDKWLFRIFVTWTSSKTLGYTAVSPRLFVSRL